MSLKYVNLLTFFAPHRRQSIINSANLIQACNYCMQTRRINCVKQSRLPRFLNANDLGPGYREQALSFRRCLSALTKLNYIKRSSFMQYHATNVCHRPAPGNNIQHTEDCMHAKSLIETWFYEVCPHGSLEASLPFRTIVKPLNPEDHPDMNKVIIKLHFDAVEDTAVPSSHQLSQISDLYDLKVDFDEDKANMKIVCDLIKGVSVPATCTLLVPIKFDLNLKLFGENLISVYRMESNVLDIESESGDCYLNNVKCGSVSALCRSGNITSKASLLGNVYFHTGKSGRIVADKLQGSSIVCETELGSVSVKSLYAENAIFRSDTGDLGLGQCHGQIYFQAEKSHLNIESLEGDLDVGIESGSVKVHLSHHSKVDIEMTTGDISVSFPEGTSTDLNLDSGEILIDKNVDIKFVETRLPHHKEGYIGEKGKAVLNARTLLGTVHLYYLSWVDAVKLTFKSDPEDEPAR